MYNWKENNQIETLCNLKNVNASDFLTKIPTYNFSRFGVVWKSVGGKLSILVYDRSLWRNRHVEKIVDEAQQYKLSIMQISRVLQLAYVTTRSILAQEVCTSPSLNWLLHLTAMTSEQKPVPVNIIMNTYLVIWAYFPALVLLCGTEVLTSLFPQFSSKS